MLRPTVTAPHLDSTGFDRSSVREQWQVPSAELTFVIGRLL